MIPAFGDVGRAVLPSPPYQSAWSIELLADDSIVYGGGDDFCSDYYGCYETGYAGRLTAGGTADASFVTPWLGDTQVSDLAVQADQKIVGVGHRAAGLAVFRMLPDGTADASFPGGGLQVLAEPPDEPQRAGTVVIDDQQRIVIAGTRGGKLFVVRLLADGTLDLTFGTGGAYVGANSGDRNSLPRIVTTSGGGYRVLFNSGGCKVLALTSSGNVDATFGTSGTAAVSGSDSACSSMAIQGDGRLLVGGDSGTASSAWRLQANGAADGTFNGSVLGGLLSEVTALTLGPAGKVLVGGRAQDSDSAGAVVRLQSTGAIDASFGKAGLARFDLEMPYGSYPTVRDMKLLTSGRVLLTGAYLSGVPRPFFVRLLADGETGPGVLAVSGSSSAVLEADGQAVVTVRRLGGSHGAVSVQYDTVPADGGEPASSGFDFTAVSGRLQWADGDTADKQVVVPVAADNATFEGEEYFALALSDPQGGAGLGANKHQVSIRGDAYPAGAISMSGGVGAVKENVATVRYVFSRQDYSHGAVSVAVTVGGTAAVGEDYTGVASQVLTWPDGDMSTRFIDLVIKEDNRHESDETVTVALSNPTGGAVLTGTTSSTLTIVDEDEKGGGGAFGALGAVLLGFAGLGRRLGRRS